MRVVVLTEDHYGREFMSLPKKFKTLREVEKVAKGRPWSRIPNPLYKLDPEEIVDFHPEHQEISLKFAKAVSACKHAIKIYAVDYYYEED